MRKIVVAMSLLVVFGSAGFAQTGSKGTSTGTSGTSAGSGVLPAPVGHRQPRAADVPSEKNLSDPNNPVNKEDALLDKKIKSICRGC
ncbi:MULTISPECIES: hypothetical protein [unclassified Bradyrhizobium]|uniref:hypothetical protein n=1 Tax=unclassified Bradyrhizobium TaxID=2631580 RepID=UPI002478E5F7|nr:MULTISPECIES: hypothetical protein [unclassified Bradyrhizobium]WGR68047.1 hypothetical protein MTX24_21590 [Bradyrhizobium sp. ISRA426]WGR80101.1 hypothetical protein MTX21_06705 [Bradyrhizobium sp. ISRA430]WGR83286.1 hypothetical protein MTX25_21270 [Bradyrhizobium sp. ISRA432]